MVRDYKPVPKLFKDRQQVIRRLRVIAIQVEQDVRVDGDQCLRQGLIYVRIGQDTIALKAVEQADHRASAQLLEPLLVRLKERSSAQAAVRKRPIPL